MEKAKIKKIIIYAAGILGLLVLLSLILAFTSSSRDPVTTFFKKIYPAVVMGANEISIYDYETYQRIALRLDSKASIRDIQGQIIDGHKAVILATKAGFDITEIEVDREYKYLTLGKDQELSNLLKDAFGGDVELLKKFVVKPSLAKAKLAIKYNSDFNRHRSEYNEATDLINQIKNGKKFEDLAKTQSDDKVSAQFGGDLGFFEQSEIIPELEQAIVSVPVNEVFKEVIVTRKGYHIIYPVGTAEQAGPPRVDSDGLETRVEAGKKLWHAKHILIETQGYDVWEAEQFAKIKTITLK